MFISIASVVEDAKKLANESRFDTQTRSERLRTVYLGGSILDHSFVG